MSHVRYYVDYLLVGTVGMTAKLPSLFRSDLV